MHMQQSWLYQAHHKPHMASCPATPKLHPPRRQHLLACVDKHGSQQRVQALLVVGVGVRNGYSPVRRISEG